MMTSRISIAASSVYRVILPALLATIAWSGQARAALPPFATGQLLVLDSNASAGNGQLFRIDRTTGAATAIRSGFGDEPWSMVLQSPTTMLSLDRTGLAVYRLDLTTGNWSSIHSVPNLLQSSSAAMLPESDHSVLIANGGGKVIRVDTVTGQQSLYVDYSNLGTQSPFGMTRTADGSLIISDLAVGKIVRITPSGTPSVISSGGLLHSLAGIVALPDGDVAVGDDNLAGRFSIVRVNLQDGSQSYITPPLSLRRFNGLSIDTNGDILAAEGQTASAGGIYRVRIIDGLITPVSTDSQLANPVAILIAPEPSTLGFAITLAGAFALRRRR